jgi:hypothetical protein
MSDNNIQFKHDFFKQAGTALVSYLDKLLNVPLTSAIPNMTKFPIMIKNTGDETFITNMHESANAETLYGLVPRLTLDVGGISIQSGQLTNPHQMGLLLAKNAETDINEAYSTNVRRIPVEWVFNSEAVFSNILEYLAFVEVYLTVSHHNHLFVFYHAGTEYSGTFFLQEDMNSDTNLQLQFDSDKRLRKLPLAFSVQLQFPAFDIYTRDGVNNNFAQIFKKNQTMQTLTHNMHVNDSSEDGIVSTINVPQ